MRIISGKLGGRILKGSAEGARPAMGKTREALFSMLEARGIVWNNLRALDLYAGTGSLGFEALSRGAARADFVDNSPALCKNLRQNAENLGVAGECAIFCMDVRAFLGSRPQTPYGLVFIDPPYRKNLLLQALSALDKNGFLAPGAFVCAEVETGAAAGAPPGLTECADRVFGQTRLALWKKN